VTSVMVLVFIIGSFAPATDILPGPPETAFN
jgi:hypothetical protein